MDHENTPTPGPGLWIGAGALLLVGGGSLFLLASDTPGMYLVGGIVVVAGLLMLAFGVYHRLRARDR